MLKVAEHALRLRSVSATSALLFADSMIDLMTGLPAEHTSHRAQLDSRTAQHALVIRAQAYTEEHLPDPDIGPAAVAAAVHTSPHTLQRLFTAEGLTVTRWIRQQRLDRCRRDLTDPTRRTCPVSAIAAAAGLPDAAHISLTFKSAFGVNPQEYRTALWLLAARRASSAPCSELVSWARWRAWWAGP
ncbi:helix-turn-helix domain-containing protein [Streptomyces sp. NPDC002896]|uniref:helix-turn-helix domain-containing protein n=1 Tax=Streptomyces sp. NPDC002896 TaxID=3154438 RepID=UPI00331B586E